MSENKELRYISHVVRDELPNRGLSKIYFYTKKEDKYYWGFDNNSLSEEYMKNLEDTEQVIKLPKLLEIERGARKGLWVDSEGNIYIADIKNPYPENPEEKLNPLENIILK